MNSGMCQGEDTWRRVRSVVGLCPHRAGARLPQDILAKKKHAVAGMVGSRQVVGAGLVVASGSVHEPEVALGQISLTICFP